MNVGLCGRALNFKDVIKYVDDVLKGSDQKVVPQRNRIIIVRIKIRFFWNRFINAIELYFRFSFSFIFDMRFATFTYFFIFYIWFASLAYCLIFYMGFAPLTYSFFLLFLCFERFSWWSFVQLKLGSYAFYRLLFLTLLLLLIHSWNVRVLMRIMDIWVILPTFEVVFEIEVDFPDNLFDKRQK